MVEELSAPLGRRKSLLAVLGPLLLQRFPWGRVMVVAITAIAATVFLRVSLVDEPAGGRPFAEAVVSTDRDTDSFASTVSTPGVLQDGRPVLVDPENGANAHVAARITGVGEPAAAFNAFGALPGLLETSQHGPIPRVGADGNSPFLAYGQPAPGAETGLPTIAIVVTGLGLDETATLHTIETLPEAVTLAFSPYAPALQHTVGAARAEGHETLLQVPLEPFDYPDSDPGPHTLLTGQAPRANLDRLYWLLARFGGYVGIMNDMGARFTSSAADMSPLLEELGMRGLGFFDDGSSNRSVAMQLASTNQVPFGRADVAVDAVPAHGPIMNALAALEAKAQQQGSAIGVMSALPISVEAVREWAAGLEGRGVALVPISAVMTRPSPPARQASAPAEAPAAHAPEDHGEVPVEHPEEPAEHAAGAGDHAGH